MSSTPLLDRIASPEDVRSLDRDQLPQLADELRKAIMDTVTVTGGHLGSGMGVVELTIALHYCFDFSDDRLVFDVGHQVYPHKLLTGRRDRFHTLRQKDGISGFTNPFESVYDSYLMGHAGTATSAALGISAGDRALGKDRRVVAVVGDAAMGAGVSFEALNFGGSLENDRTLIILNDNSWSIAKTVGALSRYLDRVRSGPRYHAAKKKLHEFLKSVPLIGDDLDEAFDHTIEQARRVVVPGHLFTELGLNYFGPIDGHDTAELIEYFERVKDLEGPILLHVRTKKGHGVPGSEDRYDRAHAAKPKKPAAKPDPAKTNEDNKTEPCVVLPQKEKPKRNQKAWTNWFAEGLEQLAEKDDKIVALTAAMPDGTGLMDFAEKFPDRFYDTGIAEQHAVAFASGLAYAGQKPVAAIYSTFLQRAYDIVFQEVLIQNLPVIFALDRAGVVGEDGMTHNGLFDIAYLRTMPNIVLCAPKDGPELQEMLEFASKYDGPIAIRYARGGAPDRHDLPGVETEHTPVELGKMETLRSGTDGAILAYGHMVQTALDAAEELAEAGLSIEVINARWAKPLDEEGILSVCNRHDKVLTLEDHTVMGGFGSAVLELCAQRGPVRAQVQLLGISDAFLEHASRNEVLQAQGLDAKGVAARFHAGRPAKV